MLLSIILQATGGTDSMNLNNLPGPAVSAWSVLLTFIDPWFWIIARVTVIGTSAIKEIFSDGELQLDPRSTDIPPKTVTVKKCLLSKITLKVIPIAIIVVGILLKWWTNHNSLGPDLIISWMMTLFVVSLLYWIAGDSMGTGLIRLLAATIPGVKGKEWLTYEEYVALGSTGKMVSKLEPTK